MDCVLVRDLVEARDVGIPYFRRASICAVGMLAETACFAIHRPVQAAMGGPLNCRSFPCWMYAVTVQ